MVIKLIPPLWLSINVSKGPYSFCLNPHIGIFWTKQTFSKGAKGFSIPVSRKIVSFIDKQRFPNLEQLTIKSSIKKLEARRDWYLASADQINTIIAKKKRIDKDTSNHP